jgi:hypothetical protein
MEYCSRRSPVFATKGMVASSQVYDPLLREQKISLTEHISHWPLKQESEYFKKEEMLQMPLLLLLVIFSQILASEFL